MTEIDIKSLPLIKFAHSYSATDYANAFRARHGLIEITYISEGYLAFESEGKKIIAEKGDVVCNIYDRALTLSSEGMHRHCTVSAVVDFEKSDCNAGGLYLPLVTKAESGLYKAYNIIDEFIQDPFYYKTHKASGAQKFLSLVCVISDIASKQNAPVLPSEKLYTLRAKEYVNKNLRMPITQKEVAKQLGITPEYLCLVFKKSEGIPLMKYVNITKLSTMKELMDKENMHLYEAALMFGYSDANYVSSLYKKLFGVNITKKGM